MMTNPASRSIAVKLSPDPATALHRRKLRSEVRGFVGAGSYAEAGERVRRRLEFLTGCDRSMILTLFSLLHAPESRNLLCDRAYGRPRPSEEETDAIKNGGLTLVYVSRPEFDPDIPFAAPVLPAPAPEFDEEGNGAFCNERPYCKASVPISREID
jgi:hypothetical protein